MGSPVAGSGKSDRTRPAVAPEDRRRLKGATAKPSRRWDRALGPRRAGAAAWRGAPSARAARYAGLDLWSHRNTPCGLKRRARRDGSPKCRTGHRRDGQPRRTMRRRRKREPGPSDRAWRETSRPVGMRAASHGIVTPALPPCPGPTRRCGAWPGRSSRSSRRTWRRPRPRPTP